MSPTCQTCSTIIFTGPRYQGLELIITIAMNIFIENTEGNHMTPVGKRLKVIYQVRIDNVTGLSLDFVDNPQIYGQSTRTDI